MMTLRQIAEYIAAEPSRPFRIRIASGQSFEIRHPEMILAGRSSVRVFAASDAESGENERWQDVSMMLMETIEPVEAPAGSRRT